MRSHEATVDRYPKAALGLVADVRLGKMLEPRPTAPDQVEVPYLRAGHLTAFPDVGDLPSMWCTRRDLTNYCVRQGDLLVAEGGDVGRAEFAPRLSEATIMQNSLHRVRTERGDVRFIRYALDAVRASGLLDVLVNRSTFGHLTSEKLSALKIPWPAPHEQATIADFLDDETSRIDAVIARRRRLVDVLDERRERAFRSALESRGVYGPPILDVEHWREQRFPAGWRVARLGQVVRQLTNGYVGPTRDILVDEGIAYVQGLHLKRGRIDFARRPFYVEPEWHEARPRTSLRHGDVLIVQTGDIGQCAVVPRDFGEANCHALLIARPRPGVVSSEFLGAYLQSELGRGALLRLATGALHPHLEFGIRQAPVILPPEFEQAEIVAEVRRVQAGIDRCSDAIGRHVALLRERRQAGISRGVNGELEIPAA